MSWLTSLLNQHDELESPQSFWYWSALASISAVVKDQIWLDRHLYKLYPNIYVLLHAESGLKKGPPISMAKQLVKNVNNTRIISGRSSIQGILKDLGTAYTAPGGKVLSKSVAFICSSELSSSIVEDKVATTILTDLYDRQYNEGEWCSLLKMESFKFKDPTITMLTATNESHSDDFFTRKDIQGGYFARTFIIHETKRHRINSLIDPLENPPNYKVSSEYLTEIARLVGAFEPLSNTAAGEYYKEWYNEFIRIMDESEFKDSTGTLNRFGDSVLKVAMLISLAEKPELVISESAMREAVIHCEKLVGNVRKTTMTRGSKKEYAEQKAIIINELLKRDNHTISRLQLMKKYTYNFNASELNEIIQSLEQAGTLKSEMQGNQVLYIMPPTVVQEYVNYFKGKNLTL
jgi:hypothetical protein